MFDTDPELAAAIEALKLRLEELPIGETASYAKLCEVAGFDVTRRRHALNRARRRAEEDSGGLFETVRGLGVRRLPSASVPDVGLAAIRRVRRAAARGAARLGTVRANDMTETDMHRLLAHKSQLGAIALVADGRKSVSLAIEGKGKELFPRDALLALAAKIGEPT